MKEYKKFKAAVKFFKNTLPFGYLLSVRRIKLYNLDGSCEMKGNKYLIKIKSELPEAHAIDVLIHEVAHAQAWGEGDDVHGEEWGKAYSLMYRLYLTQFFDKYQD